jgi:spore maturation protein CgeB
LFSVGREVVVYDSPAEAVAMIEYYESHPGEAAEIARAGQARTLREHTYASRMHELDAILRRHV